MKQIELIKKLEKYPVFNLKILKDIINKEDNYVKLVIHRLKKNNLIYKIEKNKYTLTKDPLAIASNILWPSYISCWSALRYYNLTEQLPQFISIITTRERKKKEVLIENTKMIFTKTKPEYFFGYKREKYNNFDIFVADKEKALIDSALFKKISFSEICDIVKKNVNEIDINLIINYLVKIKNKSLIKRFGFLLSKLGIDKYNVLKRFINPGYIKLDYAFVKEGKKDKKWMVINNVKL